MRICCVIVSPSHPAIDVQLHGLFFCDSSLQDPAQGRWVIPGTGLVQLFRWLCMIFIPFIFGKHWVVRKHTPRVRIIQEDLRVVRWACAQVGVVVCSGHWTPHSSCHHSWVSGLSCTAHILNRQISSALIMDTKWHILIFLIFFPHIFQFR